MAMKPLWKTAWALERRSPAFLPVVSVAAVPGTRRGRKFQKQSSHPKADNNPPRNSPSYTSIQILRESLELHANKDASSTTKTQTKPSPSRKSTTRYGMFKRLVLVRFEHMLRENDFHDLRDIGVRSAADLSREANLFRKIIEQAFDLVSQQGITKRQQNPYFWSWRNAFITGDTKALSAELRHSFTSFIVRQHLSKDSLACHEKLADFQHPHEWFPATRTMQRKIYLHVGPTNSGKTYNALKALEVAKTGIYAGPLRLLAHETYTRLISKGRRVALITGEEQRIPEGDDGYFASCTVEMTPLNQRVDVAVIDEIQMIGDGMRGWAWTQAVLGVQAKEVHLCGEERAVPLIEALCAKTGDEVVVHRYKRLSSLQPMKESLGGNFRNLKKGDAVVSFSRVNLHQLKAGIEQATGKKCAIVYGSLPPESRAQQAALFNDPNNEYDYLAASDAIGMGLNLEIKRVVFESVTKFDGTKMRVLTLPELKQIGGRAGRFRTAAQAIQAATTDPTALNPKTEAALQQSVTTSPKAEQVGLVTSLEEEDLEHVLDSFEQEAEPLQTAGLFPPSFMIEKFASYFPTGTPFVFILLRLRDIARLPDRFHMCSFRDLADLAKVIQPFPLSIRDRCIFLTAPVALADANLRNVLTALAKRVANHDSGDLLDIKEINLEILDHSPETYPYGQVNYLRNLESLHKALTLYLWLSYRYVGVFQNQGLAFHVKALVEEKINKYLDRLDFSPEARRARIKEERKAVARQQKKAEKVFSDVAEDTEETEEIQTVNP